MPVTNYTVVRGRVRAENRNGVRKAYVADSLGSTIALRGSGGVISDTWEYWPYGELRVRTGSTPTPFQYVGTLGYYTDLTGNVYVRARSYHPRTTRWMSVDPLWPSARAYSYSWSSPSTDCDPTGMQARGIWERKRPTPHRVPYRRQWGNFTDWSYGAYCGSDNIANPGWNVDPQDKLDACCQIHDRCLDAQYGAGKSETCGHFCCDYALRDCAKWAFYEGCYQQPTIDRIHCQDSAWELVKGIEIADTLHYRFGPRDGHYCECVDPADSYYIHKYWGNPTCTNPSGENTHPRLR